MAKMAVALPPLLPPASPPPPLAPPPSEGAAVVPTAEPSPQQRLPVHLRHTASSRSHALVDPKSETAGEIRALMRRELPSPAGGRLPQLGAGRADYVRHGGGDNLRELVARKRQIFLAQMSLDTKHSEIAKLEQRAHQREEALMASEQALEQDSQRFEEYLKENDAKLQEALRAAEAAASARAEKSAEAKRLAASIAGIRSGEMAKIEEQLQECQRLKAFLDGVTPEEWFLSQAAAREAKRAAMRAEWQAACDTLAAHKAEAAAAKQRAEHDMQWARTQQQWERAQRAARDAAAALRDALAQQNPPEPDYSTVEQEEEQMYFQDPAQLLAIFSQLEGSNMFQIAAAQEAEAALEVARATHAATQARLDGEAGALRLQVAELEAAIAASRERCAALRAAEQHDVQGGTALLGSNGAAGASSSSAGGPAGAGPQAQQAGAAAAAGPAEAPSDGASTAGTLAERLAAAYQAAGFALDASVTPLQMLQKVEAALEECLVAIGPPGSPGALAAEAVERARERERRQVARATKLAARQAEHEARIQRVLERAAAPKFQKKGKPAMMRSVLQQEEEAAGGGGSEDEEAELAAYLARIDATFGCE